MSGWLAAKPKDCKETRAEMFGGELPDLPPSEMVVDYWQELGFAGIGYSGYIPFSWQEIAAFVSCGGYDIAPVEARVLVDMSKAFAREYADDNPLSISPVERT